MQTVRVVRARPIVSARWAVGAAVFTVGLFTVTAVLMKRYNAGAKFGTNDQFGTFVLGLVLAGLLLLITRPRLEADETSVRLRGFVTPWREIPWDVIVAVDFPAKLRFARLVLPADEAIAILAVQRLDRAQAVEVMRGLRALFAATHPVDS